MKIFIALVLSLATALLFVAQAYAQEAYTVKVSRVIDIGYGAGLEAIGTIRNNSNTTFRSAVITVTLYDAKGQILDTALGSIQNANGVLPGQTGVWTAVIVSGNLHSAQVKSAEAVPTMVNED